MIHITNTLRSSLSLQELISSSQTGWDGNTIAIRERRVGELVQRPLNSLTTFSDTTYMSYNGIGLYMLKQAIHGGSPLDR
jgi:hypothetical protein